MWESRRDLQRVWEGWEVGFMAFHAFHTLSFPWPAYRAVNAQSTDTAAHRGLPQSLPPDDGPVYLPEKSRINVQLGPG